jgi:lipopolysaccharide/colanic/teichoic acid biosynthesis glycosyltransferase
MTVPLTGIERAQPLAPALEFDQAPNALERIYQEHVGDVVALPRWKRALDLAVSMVALLVLAPLFLAVSLAIVLESRGAPFYRQRRVGHGGRAFTCIKFRSMRRDADRQQAALLAANEATGHMFKLKRDPRITRVGRFIRKTSIDELPQLFNVLAGSMSLVGPRPPLPSEVRYYQPRHLARLRTSPGLTGKWQVEARGRYDFEEMVALDVAYAEGFGFVQDLSILMKTVPAVLSCRGAC